MPGVHHAAAVSEEGVGCLEVPTCVLATVTSSTDHRRDSSQFRNSQQKDGVARSATNRQGCAFLSREGGIFSHPRAFSVGTGHYDKYQDTATAAAVTYRERVSGFRRLVLLLCPKWTASRLKGPHRAAGR